MTSVGIMSMQRIHNYGSTLQAYALMRLVQQADGEAQVDFIDYRPGPVLGNVTAQLENKATRTISKIVEHARVQARLRDKLAFFNHKRKYTNAYLPLIGISAEINRPRHLDVQIIGSDEVFNCTQENTLVGYTRDLFGHHSPANMLASYAASFGNATLERLELLGVRDQVADDLGKFDALSVRDRNSQNLVHELTGRDALVHLDPTLVYDFAPDTIGVRANIPTQPYMIVYGYSGRLSASENAAVRRFADQHGLLVLSIGGLQPCADRYVDCDPLQLLRFFRGARYVVTDTFHGTIFSVINETPFATLIRKTVGNSYGNEEKLGFLLESLGLEQRRWDHGFALSDTLMTPIDFSDVRTLRQTERKRTQEYLMGLLTTEAA